MNSKEVFMRCLKRWNADDEKIFYFKENFDEWFSQIPEDIWIRQQFRKISPLRLIVLDCLDRLGYPWLCPPVGVFCDMKFSPFSAVTSADVILAMAGYSIKAFDVFRYTIYTLARSSPI